MNREDIIRMAREAGFDDYEQDEMLMRFAALVAAAEGDRIAGEAKHIIKRAEARGAAAEREACAAVCCDMIDAEYKTGKVDHNEMAWTQACANAIRARSKQ